MTEHSKQEVYFEYTLQFFVINLFVHNCKIPPNTKSKILVAQRLHMEAAAVPHSLHATQVAYIHPHIFTFLRRFRSLNIPILTKNKPIVIVRGALRHSLHYPNCDTERKVLSAFPSCQPIIITQRTRSSRQIQDRLIGRAGFDCKHAYMCVSARARSGTA
jgi:hypothetical protein